MTSVDRCALGFVALCVSSLALTPPYESEQANSSQLRIMAAQVQPQDNARGTSTGQNRSTEGFLRVL
jgi:hypothetical protein